MSKHLQHKTTNTDELRYEFLRNAPNGQMQVLRVQSSDGVVREFFGPSLMQSVPVITDISFGPEISLRQVLFLLSYRPMDHETCN